MRRVPASRLAILILLAVIPATIAAAADGDLLDRVEHGYTDSGGVRIHHASLGSADDPLIVMLHGFPDYWYTWRRQMDALAAKGYRCVAIDLRGYNRSDKPQGVDQYAMRLLIADVVAVIHDLSGENGRAIVCGHDWGGAIAWSVAMYRPDVVERLMILNLPHPNGLAREMSENPRQQANSQYARDFQAEGAHEHLTAEGLAAWVTDADARPYYIEAFERSDFEAMLNYYKANFPRTPAPGPGTGAAPAPTTPPVQCPALVLHGLDDPALLASGLNDTWEWVDAELTIVTIPGAGHFVQQDASEAVTRAMGSWLDRTAHAQAPS